MEYLEILERIQQMYPHRIVIMSCGAFYISIGEDAVILSKELNLKVTCAKKYICKVGIPKSSIEKYKEKLDKTQLAYIILDYDKTENKIVKKCSKDGGFRPIYDFNVGCNQCKNNKIQETEYDTALSNYVKKEFGESSIMKLK